MKKHTIYLRLGFSLLLTILICPMLMFNVSANSNNGFIVKEMSETEALEFLEAINLTTASAIEKHAAIYSFDVSESGLIALAFQSGTEQKINIIDINGTFQYGFTFKHNGSFGVDWQGQNLTIYFVRSNVIATFSPTGECISIAKLDNNANGARKHNNSYFHKEILSRTRYHNGTVYKLSGVFGTISLSNSKLIAINDSGTQQLLYDASHRELFVIGLLCIACLIPTTAVLIPFLRRRKAEEVSSA